MKPDSNINAQPNQRTYYTRRRWFVRYMAHLIAGMFIVWTFWFLREIYGDPSFALMLIVYIPVAVYSVAFFYALTDTCVIISPTGIEYKRPEFSIIATWSQIKSVKRSAFASMLGVHYLLLDAPTLTYTKWLGTAYKLQLGHLLSPSHQKRIPLGKNVWEANEELENEIRTKIPSLPFDTP